MGRKCSISNCRSEFYENGKRVSLFKSPSNIELYKKWEEVIQSSGNTFTKNTYVCEKHFRKENVKKELIVKDKSGNVVLQSPLKKPRLLPTAIPTIFNNYDENKENTYDDSTENLESLLEIKEEPLSGPSPSDLSTTLANDNHHSDSDYTNSLELNAAALNDKSTDQLPILPCDNPIPVNESNCVSVIDEKTENNISSINSSNTCTNYNFIGREFFKIVSNCHYITSWAIHKVEEPRKMLIAAKITPVFTKESMIAPIIEKQVVLEENGKCQTFILNKLLDLGDNHVNSLEEFQLLIRKVDSWHVCVGGPSISQYKNVNSITAYKDITNKWRHNLCKLVLERGIICKECLKVERTLRRQLGVLTKSKCPAKINLTLSLPIRTHIKAMKEEARVTKQALRRSKIRCQALKDEIRNARNEIAKISETGLEESLTKHQEKYGIPHNQELIIKECLRASKYKSPKGNRYNNEWLLLCLLLYKKSPTTYNFLRNNKILPLPAHSTVTKYVHVHD
ncbi:uncharacterized protein LOC143218463 [Lasioglossum baleicum]|uniref:uncharacterized protein LOC143218463 n=1 Tax=Lasioglossum baleicum TaxID=434251 RepID=UPI003FCDBF96